MIEHVFEELMMDPVEPGWFDLEPGPGDEGYESFLAWEAQHDAFWNAYAAGVARPAELLGGRDPDLSGMRADAGLLDEVERQARAESAAAGAKLRAIGTYALRQMANPAVGYDEKAMAHSVQAEVGLRLRVTPQTASTWLDLALTLTRRLPKTLAALENGAITQPTGRMLAEESANLNVAQCAQLEDTVLAKAGNRTTSSLQRTARREVEKLDVEAVRKRREQAREDRTLYVKDGHDGMATLCAVLPSEQAYATYEAIRDRVQHQDHSLSAEARRGELRAVGARRVDTLVELIAAALGTDPYAPRITECSALTADQIAELDKGADTYVPSPAMKRAIRARDKHCRFPGCRRPAIQCDVDHTIAFVKVGGTVVRGPTVYANLSCVCRFHHRIKQMPGWHLEQDGRGRLTWTTPTDIRLLTYPPPDDGEEPPDFTPAGPAPELVEDEFPF